MVINNLRATSDLRATNPLSYFLGTSTRVSWSKAASKMLHPFNNLLDLFGDVLEARRGVDTMTGLELARLGGQVQLG